MTGRGPAAALLPDGRLHLQHGPIDLIVSAEGDTARAFEAARQAFDGLLESLAAELPLLRQPLGEAMPPFEGSVARAMARACFPFRAEFITPMAAVAGAVADHILAAMTGAADLRRALVNNGGDIAMQLAEAEEAVIAVADRPDKPAAPGRFKLRSSDLARGIATSGWRGRSFSLGIADAVTILARNAAEADAAATIVANAVNAEHPAVTRAPARDIQIDSDLGARLVTTTVNELPPDIIAQALGSGEARARALIAAGLIHGAVLQLQGNIRVAGGAAFSLAGSGAAREKDIS